jgi:5-methylcytosine-specific restriction protein A
VASRRRTGPTDTVRALVHARDGGRCARCNTPRNLTIHHRVNRGMGGAREEWINQAHNLLLVCTTCNGWFEDNPREAYAQGWKVRRPQLPAEVPVTYPGGRTYLLTPDGVRTAARPRAEVAR